MKPALLVVVMPILLSAAVPGSYSLRVPNQDSAHDAKVLAADRSGNLFIVSTFARTSATTAVQVVKTDSAGRAIASFDFGSSGISIPQSAAVDGQGNLIVIGSTTAADFPLVSAVRTEGSTFVVKLTASLDRIVFATRLGSKVSSSSVAAVAVDPSGNIYATGTTASGFATTPGALQTEPPPPGAEANFYHGYVISLSPAGALLYATYFTGTSFVCPPTGRCSTSSLFFPAPPNIETAPSAIAADATGAVILAGTTNSTGIPVTSGSLSSECACDALNKVAFIVKIAPGGSKLLWGTYLPLKNRTTGNGIQQVTISSIALDSSGNVAFAGIALDDFPIQPGAPQPTMPGGQDRAGYVARLNSTGSKLLSATWLGGPYFPAPNLGGPAALALDGSGNIWVTGNASGATLPSLAGAPIVGDSYVAGLSADGTSVLSLVTAPAGTSGASIQVSGNTIAALGPSGSLLLSSASPGPSLLGVVGTFSFSAAKVVVPRQLLSLYGVNIGPSVAQTADTSSGAIPKVLGGTQVLFDGIPAAMTYAGPTQINVIVPSAIANRTSTTLSITGASGAIAGPTLAVQETLPQVVGSFFGDAAAVNQDGSINSPAHRAAPGSIVSIFLTGAGALSSSPDSVISSGISPNPFPVSVLANDPSQPRSNSGTSLEVTYAGDAPGQPSGIIQVNFLLPTDRGIGPLQIQVGNATAPFRIVVQ